MICRILVVIAKLCQQVVVGHIDWSLFWWNSQLVRDDLNFHQFHQHHQQNTVWITICWWLTPGLITHFHRQKSENRWSYPHPRSTASCKSSTGVGASPMMLQDVYGISWGYNEGAKGSYRPKSTNCRPGVPLSSEPKNAERVTKTKCYLYLKFVLSVRGGLLCVFKSVMNRFFIWLLSLWVFWCYK